MLFCAAVWIVASALSIMSHDEGDLQSSQVRRRVAWESTSSHKCGDNDTCSVDGMKIASNTGVMFSGARVPWETVIAPEDAVGDISHWQHEGYSRPFKQSREVFCSDLHTIPQQLIFALLLLFA